MIKATSDTSEAAFVTTFDKALEGDFEGFKQEKDPTKWPQYLREQDGQTATRFIFRPMNPSKLSAIMDRTYHGIHFETLCWEVFCSSLIDIQNGPTAEVTDDNGQRKILVPKNKDGTVDKEWLEKVFVKDLRVIAVNVGGFAWRWNHLGDNDVPFLYGR